MAAYDPAMLLAVDVGNSNVTIGSFRNGSLVAVRRAGTPRGGTADELELLVEGLLSLDDTAFADVSAVVVASVVPAVTVGREIYKGFESGIYNTALDNAGYPASSLLPPGVQARKPVTKPVKKTVPAAGAEGASAATPPETADSGAAPADTAAPQR